MIEVLEFAGAALIVTMIVLAAIAITGAVFFGWRL